MMFFSSLSDAVEEHPYRTAIAKHCFCCGLPLKGPLVAYDAHPIVENLTHRVLMHRSCAFAMAQRIICDAWPTRYEDNKPEKGDEN